MEKTATLNLRINPTLKAEAESVLGRLGIPMSTAVDIFLNQVVLIGGIPFPVTLHPAPESLDIGQMTESQIHSKLQKGYEDYKSGDVQEASAAFAAFRENYGK